MGFNFIHRKHFVQAGRYFAVLVVGLFCLAGATAVAAPIVQTQAATSITTSSATVNSFVNANGATTTIHFDYGLTASYGSSTTSGNIGTGSGNFGTSISGLSPNTTYHFRIVASNSGGTVNGSDLTFTTLANAPTAQTQAATLVTSSSATVNSFVNANGATTTIHFDYGLTASYGSSTTSGNIGTGSGNFGTAISGLSPNTTYHFRIVASSSGGTANGSDLTFTTLAAAPTAQSQAATLITSSSATLNSFVNANGATTTIHFDYGLTASYGNSTTSGNIGTGSGNFGAAISGLSPNTTYHFRIVASSSGGTANGSDLTFTTLANAPTAQTQAATLITATSATLNSFVDPSGSSTTIHFEYGLTSSYGSSTISGNIGTTAGNYGTSVTGLSPNTTYHFRIVASSGGGTANGNDLTFTTSATAPIVQTLAATLVTASSATVNSSVDPNGASTTIHFEYGLTASYGSSTISGSIGTTAGNYGTAISGLSPNTTYHFRIVASSTGGTVNGGDLTFTTSTSGPIAQTLAANTILTTSAQVNGSINPNGLATSAHFEYGTTASYGASTPTGNFGTTSQNIAYTISGLAPNTTYHFRIVASNSGGTANGNDATFTTTSSGAPTIQTLAATAATTTTAQFNGSMNPNGLVSTAYFEYGLTTTYGSATTVGNFGTTVQNIGFVQTGLTPSTTYHFRIVASNSQGTTRGLDATFTTLPTSAPAQQAWVAGTSGLGLRLRNAPGLTSTILLVLPEGSVVSLLGDTQNADGYLWRHLTYAAQDGWADAQYLAFTPGTTPIPPAGPITLRQVQADGISPIPAGGMATGPSVILAATPSGPSSQQFSLQFEVRPSGTAFSNPTATTTHVPGGSEILATVSALANQNYHWRARVLDGNGVPSAWVAFSGSSIDFAVNSTTSPLASFSWSPAQVFTGDSIAFVAQAAGQAGLTFSWDFGGGQTATGGTANNTFSQSGDTAVTLTVTDAQNNQSQKTLTVSVASKNLVDRINVTASQADSLMDQVLADATSLADAADYFSTDVQSTSDDIAATAALTAASLMFDDGDTTQLAQRCVDWTRQTYGDAAAAELLAKDAIHFAATETGDHIRDEFTKTIAKRVASNVGSGTGVQTYHQMWIPGLTSLVIQKKADIEQLRQQAVTAAGSLNPTQTALMVQNLQSRILGNIALQTSYHGNANLPISFQDFKSSDEVGWTTYNIGQHLFSISTSLLGTALGGVGGVVAGVAAKASQAELDIFNSLATQSAEVQLLSSSLAIGAQGTLTVNKVAANCETGLNDVINNLTPPTPAGNINSILPYSQGTYFSTVDLTPRWFATSAYADVIIQNSGQQIATYRMEAFLTKTFVTGQLPINFLGLGQRKYDIQVATAQDGIVLSPGAQKTVRLTFLAGDGGSIPEGQDITYVLTSRTTDGYYRQDSQIQHFGTTYLDQNGNVVDPALVASAIVSQPPLQSSLLMFPGTNLCELKITVQNTLEVPTMFDLGQDLPSGAIIIDAGGGTYGNNHLSWQLNMQPGELQFFQVVLQLQLPVSNPPLAPTTVVAYDAVNVTSVSFSQAPVVSQLVSSPPMQLQPSGFSGGGFGLDVQAFIPGIYRIDATTNFSTWNTIQTTTNITGAFHVIDPAQNQPLRFYRAARLQ